MDSKIAKESILSMKNKNSLFLISVVEIKKKKTKSDLSNSSFDRPQKAMNMYLTAAFTFALEEWSSFSARNRGSRCSSLNEYQERASNGLSFAYHMIWTPKSEGISISERHFHSPLSSSSMEMLLQFPDGAPRIKCTLLRRRRSTFPQCYRNSP